MISIIMLTYNRETLMPRAIKSILCQSYRDFEFIIVDNGSSDKSGEIADSYAVQDGRIRVIHLERSTIGVGRNAGLDAARSDYVTFIDDDDWAEPDYLEFLLQLLEENKADISICGASDKAFDEKKVMTAEEALIELMWRKKYNMAFPAKLFRRSLFDGEHFPQSGSVDDIALMYRIIAKANLVAYHGLPKYTFYRHDSNNSAWTTHHELLTGEILREYLRAYRTRTEWLSGIYPDSASAFRYFEWSFMISMVEKIVRLNLSDCAGELAEMRGELSEHECEFLSCPEIQDFEKEWMSRYIAPAEKENRVASAKTRKRIHRP